MLAAVSEDFEAAERNRRIGKPFHISFTFVLLFSNFKNFVHKFNFYQFMYTFYPFTDLYAFILFMYFPLKQPEQYIWYEEVEEESSFPQTFTLSDYTLAYLIDWTCALCVCTAAALLRFIHYIFSIQRLAFSAWNAVVWIFLINVFVRATISFKALLQSWDFKGCQCFNYSV